MCDLCEGFAETIRIASPADLDDLLSRTHSAVAAGTLEPMDADPALRARVPGSPLPRSQPVKQTWVCTQCSRLFLLELNACHLAGDGWRPLFGN
ncbi:MAG: hypothetical protein H0V44_16910 [Planctomycetes bacterium]|nr:hypothetical protein [Planctomycetota bacterium]